MSLKQSKEEQQLRNSIDRIEDAYEFMIAYAAQGRRLETNDDGPSKIRAAISAFLISIQEIEATGLTKINEDAKAFEQRFIDDMLVVKNGLQLLEAKTSISSDMVDNTNALLSMRSFLTSIFFIDQVLLPERPSE